MKLYTVNGYYHGTQAEAKAAAREQGADFEQVDVPTSKDELIQYLNGLVAADAASYVEDDYTPVVERQDPPAERDERVAQTVDLDEMFGNAPLGQQLTLAAIALENARSRIGRENAPKPAPQGYGGKVERAAPTEDDDIFA